MDAHIVDYKIHGNDLQFVEIILDPAETVIGEAGSMFYLESGIDFTAKIGDGANPEGGFFGKLAKMGKRMLANESVFITHYTNKDTTAKSLSFSAPYPGKIIPIELCDYNDTIICQKDSFICAALGTSINIEFIKKFGAGFFGGEGFILEKLEGNGRAFLHACGGIYQRKLNNETLRVSTGNVVAFTSDINYDIQMVKGLKSALFSGSGIFLTTLSGTGTVWLQSLPFEYTTAASR